MKNLATLLDKDEIISHRGDLSLGISGVNHDSRNIRKNNCFVAIRGYNKEGLDFMNDAVMRGANSIVAESEIKDEFPDVTYVRVKNDRVALSKLASRFYENPSEEMYVIGVTGTNGKTTVVSIINDILKKEFITAKIGTLGMICKGISRKTELTTPEATEIFEFLSLCKSSGCNNLVMEVSSVGLRLHRVEDIRFSQALFTTFSGDHLDFHKTMEEYFRSKMLLFEKLSADDWAVINIDDPYSKKILGELRCNCLTYGFSESADIRPVDYRLIKTGIYGKAQTPEGEIEIESSLIGRVNLSNILAAVASSIVKGISLEKIHDAVKNFKAVKGRMDFVYDGDFSVIIDYAHTDKALEALLRSLREVVTNRIILVFGAGGSRDKTKRPRMGEVASKNSDFIVVTSDNPRKEDPAGIIRDVVGGFDRHFKDFFIVEERENAIRKALDLAEKGDMVVVAGKGHEDYQIFKDRTIHFDDYEVVRKILRGKNA